MEGPLAYLLVGALTCFIGTIPFGPINLAVVKVTVDYSYRRGIEVAVAAALIEMVEASIAISCGMLISTYLDSNTFIKIIIASIFIVLAGIVFTRKPDPTLAPAVTANQSFFFRGLVLAALNPQAIPFWIVALAAITQYTGFAYSGINLIGFLLGVFTGKLVALLAFAYASNYLKAHLQESGKRINQLLAAILLLIGITQLWNAL